MSELRFKLTWFARLDSNYASLLLGLFLVAVQPFETRGDVIYSFAPSTINVGVGVPFDVTLMVEDTNNNAVNNVLIGIDFNDYANLVLNSAVIDTLFWDEIVSNIDPILSTMGNLLGVGVSSSAFVMPSVPVPCAIINFTGIAGGATPLIALDPFSTNDIYSLCLLSNGVTPIDGAFASYVNGSVTITGAPTLTATPTISPSPTTSPTPTQTNTPLPTGSPTTTPPATSTPTPPGVSWSFRPSVVNIGPGIPFDVTLMVEDINNNTVDNVLVGIDFNDYPNLILNSAIIDTLFWDEGVSNIDPILSSMGNLLGVGVSSSAFIMPGVPVPCAIINFTGIAGGATPLIALDPFGTNDIYSLCLLGNGVIPIDGAIASYVNGLVTISGAPTLTATPTITSTPTPSPTVTLCSICPTTPTSAATGTPTSTPVVTLSPTPTPSGMTWSFRPSTLNVAAGVPFDVTLMVEDTNNNIVDNMFVGIDFNNNPILTLNSVIIDTTFWDEGFSNIDPIVTSMGNLTGIGVSTSFFAMPGSPVPCAILNFTGTANGITPLIALDPFGTPDIYAFCLLNSGISPISGGIASYLNGSVSVNTSLTSTSTPISTNSPPPSSTPTPTRTVTGTSTSTPTSTPTSTAPATTTPLQIPQCDIDTIFATLNNPSPDEYDEFGKSVAISGDLAVVGVLKDDSNGNEDTGTAYIIDSSTGVLVTTLSQPSPLEDHFFGFSVAISGNLAVISGEESNSGGFEYGGIAYVFNALTGELISTLIDPTPDGSARFGGSVAISGNLVVVGGFGWGDEYGGEAFVFNATTGQLITALENPTIDTGDFFGFSVAISGNFAVVSAVWDDGPTIRAEGTVYVFNALTGALISTLINPTPDRSGEYFGYSVGISGNLAIVGTIWDEPTGIGEEGTAYVFNATTGELLSTLNNPTPNVRDLFGLSVSISGNTAIVGSSNIDDDGINSVGEAYVFEATSGTLQATIKNPAPSNGGWFGYVAVSGNRAIIGAPGSEWNGSTRVGSAYLLTCSSLLPTATPCPVCSPYPSPSPSVTPTPPPSIDVSPQEIDFGTHDYNAPSPVQMDVTITNIGLSPLQFTGVELELVGIFAPHFSILNDTGENILNPTEQRIVTLGFNPFSYGKKIASLRIYSNDPVRPTVGVRLEGLSNAALINVSKQNLSFNDWWVQAVDLSPPQNIQIKNIGNLPLDFMGNEIEIIGAQVASFFIMSDTGEGTLPPGASRSIEIAFHPIQTGNNLAYLSITSTDGDQPTLDVALLGAGVGKNPVGGSWVLYK